MELKFFDVELGERMGEARSKDGRLLLYYRIIGKRTVNLSAISRKLLRSGFEKIRQVPGRLVVLRKNNRIIAIDSKGRIRAKYSLRVEGGGMGEGQPPIGSAC